METIRLSEIASIITRALMDRAPNEITIADYKLDHYYVVQVAGNRYLAPTFQQATLPLAGWIGQFGLDHISFSLWCVNPEGQPIRWMQLSSNELYYIAIYNWFIRNRLPIVSLGIVKFERDRIVPTFLLDGTEERYQDEILFRYFMDAPAWLLADGKLYSRRMLSLMYGDDSRMQADFFDRNADPVLRPAEIV